MNHQKPHLFKTYAHHQRPRNTVTRNGYGHNEHQYQDPLEDAGPADDCLIWEVARATSAAPSYFNPIKIGRNKYIDGGFGVNNPSSSIFLEVSQMNHDRNEANKLSVSIGTGISRFTLCPTGRFNKPIGWLQGAKKVSTDCENDFALMRNMTRGRHMFFRFNVPEKSADPDTQRPSKIKRATRYLHNLFGKDLQPLDRGLSKIKLDEWKKEGFWRKESTKDEIKRITDSYVTEVNINAQLEKVARLMVEHRRRRAEDQPRWEAYALGIRYTCALKYVGCQDEVYKDRDALRRHLIEDHEYLKGPEDTEDGLEILLEQGRYIEYHH